jgi:hypothetical protein
MIQRGWAFAKAIEQSLIEMYGFPFVPRASPMVDYGELSRRQPLTRSRVSSKTIPASPARWV